ncbi:MAG: 3-mercaptopyruvate sulfurtransferase [Alphaproteobacteria bacterium]|nr:3-mercaptopyruvate sulfurtransferase [Alphaproteobacteria bacterium]
MRDRWLVDTETVAGLLDAPDVRLVDASWYLPVENRDALSDYRERHIAGAVFFDIDDISDESTDLPHMLPRPEKFSSRVRSLGLGDGVRIVVYDGGNMMAAARAWWMFRVFGHDDVQVLDGGLAKWMAEGRPVDDEPVIPRERHFTPRLNTFLVRDIGQMKTNLASSRAQVVDARGRGRFAGEEAEFRPGLRSGHIPGSRNLPYTSLLHEDGTIVDNEAIAAAFHDAGIDPARPVITTCGSGISACFLALALDLAGFPDAAVYDGSWTEWGGAADTPVATGDP